MEDKKKVNLAAVKRIAGEISSPDKIIRDILEVAKLNGESKDFVMKVKTNDITFEIWKSTKKDGKFEVIRPNAKTAEKNSHQRMTREEIFQDIIFKAFFTSKENPKIINENK